MQDVERVAAYAREMSEFLMESELTETKAFIRSFVKQVAVVPGRATIHYTIPTPEDNGIGGADIVEIALSRQVMSSVTRGGPGGFEPPASSMPLRRAPNCATGPRLGRAGINPARHERRIASASLREQGRTRCGSANVLAVGYGYSTTSRGRNPCP